MRRSLLFALVLIALAIPSSIAVAAEKSYVRDPLTSKLAQHPGKLRFSDVDLTGLKWIHWGRSRAIARGNANVLICEPSCAGGHRERGTVRVVVRKRKAEGDRRVYQCIQARITGVPKAYSRVSWMC